MKKLFNLTMIILVLLLAGCSNKKFIERGITQAMEGEYEAAIDEFTQAINKKPKSAEAYILRGRARFASVSRITRVSKNFSCIEEIITRGNITERQKLAFDMAIDDLTTAIKLKQKNAVAYRDRAVVYMDKGDYDNSMADYNQAIALNPKYAVAYNGRGCLYLIIEDYDSAINDYNEAIKLNPYYIHAYHGRGNSFYDKEDYDNAIADYTKIIELDPNYVWAYDSRGSSYYFKNDYDRAIADFEEVLRITPDDDLTRSNIETLRSMQGR